MNAILVTLPTQQQTYRKNQRPFFRDQHRNYRVHLGQMQEDPHQKPSLPSESSCCCSAEAVIVAVKLGDASVVVPVAVGVPTPDRMGCAVGVPTPDRMGGAVGVPTPDRMGGAVGAAAGVTGTALGGAAEIVPSQFQISSFAAQPQVAASLTGTPLVVTVWE